MVILFAHFFQFYFLDFTEEVGCKIKLFSNSFSELMTSSLVPSHSFLPWLIKIMCSPIPITEFMSWVLMMVVVLNSLVIECISSSMTSDVLGSSPEFGSSQNRYLGCRAMARAMATRFAYLRIFHPDTCWLHQTGLRGQDRTWLF